MAARWFRRTGRRRGLDMGESASFDEFRTQRQSRNERGNPRTRDIVWTGMPQPTRFLKSLSLVEKHNNEGDYLFDSHYSKTKRTLDLSHGPTYSWAQREYGSKKHWGPKQREHPGSKSQRRSGKKTDLGDAYSVRSSKGYRYIVEKSADRESTMQLSEIAKGMPSALKEAARTGNTSGLSQSSAARVITHRVGRAKINDPKYEMANRHLERTRRMGNKMSERERPLSARLDNYKAQKRSGSTQFEDAKAAREARFPERGAQARARAAGAEQPATDAGGGRGFGFPLAVGGAALTGAGAAGYGVYRNKKKQNVAKGLRLHGGWMDSEDRTVGYNLSRRDGVGRNANARKPMDGPILVGFGKSSVPPSFDRDWAASSKEGSTGLFNDRAYNVEMQRQSDAQKKQLPKSVAAVAGAGGLTGALMAKKPTAKSKAGWAAAGAIGSGAAMYGGGKALMSHMNERRGRPQNRKAYENVLRNSGRQGSDEIERIRAQGKQF